MFADGIVRRLGGALKNAVVWGVAWAALGFVAILAMRTIGVVVPERVTVLDALGMAIKFGVMGGITGGAFSILISMFYRGRRLSQISALRFGIGGGIVAGLFVPAFMLTMNALSGDGLVPWSAIRGDVIFAALFGGIAAGASMWLAQRAETMPDTSEAERASLASGDPVFSTSAKDARQAERASRGAR